MDVDSGYLTCVLTPDGFAGRVREVVAALTPVSDTFESVAFRGMSGGMVAPSVAAALGKRMVLVRKPDGNHSGRYLEGTREAGNYVIVDDLIASGATVREIISRMKSDRPDASCVGVVLYNAGEFLKQTSEFFRSNKHLNWLHCGDVEGRAADFVSVAKFRGNYIDNPAWEEAVYGRTGEECPMKPLLDVFFPTETERAWLRSTAGWADLEAYRAKKAAANAA